MVRCIYRQKPQRRPKRRRRTRNKLGHIHRLTRPKKQTRNPRRNNFRYADCLYDIDYTAVPTAWAINITLILKNHIKPEDAKQLLHSFLIGGKQSTQRNKKQQKVTNHERLD